MCGVCGFFKWNRICASYYRLFIYVLPLEGMVEIPLTSFIYVLPLEGMVEIPLTSFIYVLPLEGMVEIPLTSFIPPHMCTRHNSATEFQTAYAIGFFFGVQ